MSKKLIIILLVVLVAGTGAFLTYLYVFREAPLTVENQKPDVVISASGLINAFSTDEKKATRQYSGKIIQVRGRINEINLEQTSITVVLKESDDESGVLCTFDRSAAKPGDFKKGKIITVKGVCNGYLLDVALNKCSLIK